MFETRLLIIITAATLLVTAFAIALSWVANRRIRGAHYWSLGYFCLAGGVILQATQSLITPVVSVALANVLLTCGIYYTYIGVSLYQGHNIRYRISLLLLVLFVVAVHAVGGLGKEGFVARTLLISGLIGLISFMIGYGFYKAAHGGRELAYRMNAAVYFLLSAAFTTRALSAFFIPLQTSAIDNTVFSYVTYLGATIFNILIAFSYLFTLYGSHGLAVQRVVDTDTLTGLFNRQGLCRSTDLLLKRMQGLGGEVSALFLTLYPHQAGEETKLLQGFAEKLLRSFQASDLLARIGEHEFAAVVANADKEKLAAIADSLQQFFRQHGIEGEGETLFFELEYVVIDAARATRGFEEMWQRAVRVRNYRNTEQGRGELDRGFAAV